MLLTTSNMSELLGVSRMTYYGWVKGKKSVRTMIRKYEAHSRILDLMTDGWPTPEVIAMEQKYRFERLLEVMKKQGSIN